MDGSAYVDKDQWQGLLDELGVTTIQLRDQRYDAVIHLVTAADGAENFYDSATNEARYESPEEAKEKDMRIREAYLSHPKWFLIDNNCTNFDEKMLNAKMAVHSVLSAPIGEHFDAKYLIKHEKDLADLQDNNEPPIDRSKFPTHEQVDIILDFIILKNSEGKRTLGSIEKRGNENSGYCYIQNLQF